MNVRNDRWKIGVMILAASTLLALAKPAVHLMFDSQMRSDAGSLNWDYGVPTQWYGHSPQEERPPGVRLPTNSIGQDFLSLDTYIRCAGLGPDMYRIYCPGDPFDRPFAYPPLLTWMFMWIQWLPTASAAALWSMAVLVLVLVVGMAWGILASKFTDNISLISILIPVFLLTVSYPAVFAFERGNTDIIILILLTLTAVSFVRRHWFWAGFWPAVAAVAKLYPAPICAAVAALALSLLVTERERRAGLWLLAGSAVGILLPLGTLFRQHVYYFQAVLPFLRSAQMPNPDCSFCHSWPAAYGTFGYGLTIALLMVAIGHFIFFARRFTLNAVAEDGVRSLTGLALVMAVTVYVPDTSYDYSLILLFPLFLMCMLWGRSRSLDLKSIGFVVLLVGATAPRWLEGLVWSTPGNSVFLILQTAGLAMLGLSLAVESVRIWKQGDVS